MGEFIRTKEEQEFLNKYGTWISEKLAVMPRESSDDKNKRWNLFKEQEWYTEFVVSAKKIIARTSKQDIQDPSNKNLDNERLRDEDDRKYFDNLAYFKALKDNIETFTGHSVKNPEKKIGFLLSLQVKYKQISRGEKSKRNVEQQLGGASGYKKSTSDHFARILVLLNKWAAIKGVDPGHLTEKDICTFEKELKLSENKKYITKDMHNLLLRWISPAVASVDEIWEANDGEDTLADEGGTTPEDIELSESDKGEKIQMIMRLAYPEDSTWKNVLNVRERAIFRLFIMPSILHELKTEMRNDEECAYPDIPAGDPEIYQLLRPYDKILVRGTEPLFFRSYLDLAIDFEYYEAVYSRKEPEDNLYDDVYAPFLKSGFSFEDKALAEALKISKPAISQKRTRYKNIETKIFDIFMKLQE